MRPIAWKWTIGIFLLSAGLTFIYIISLQSQIKKLKNPDEDNKKLKPGEDANKPSK